MPDPSLLPPSSDTLAARPGFGVDVSYGDLETIASVRGDLDSRSAPGLRGLLRALVAESERSMVLDLAGLTFIDAAGLGVIVDAVQLLAERLDTLVVRSTPAGPRRLFAITGVLDHITMDDDVPADDEVVGAHVQAEMARMQLRHAHEEVLDAILRVVTGLTSDAVLGAAGASIILHRSGQMATVAATDEIVVRMDGHQHDTGEGPCLSAAAEGIPYFVDSLAEEERWPDFIPRARALGITSVASTPLVVDGRSVGALNVYSSAPAPFGAREHELCAMFATAASDLVGASPVNERSEEHAAARVREALLTRDLIGRAQGVLMGREGITALQAAAELHRSARSSGTAVRAAAAEVLQRAATAARGSSHCRVRR